MDSVPPDPPTVGIAVITMIAQIYYRHPICSGATGCRLSFTNGVVWSGIWPAYWAIQWNLLS
jgi:hypothetical protein